MTSLETTLAAAAARDAATAWAIHVRDCATCTRPVARCRAGRPIRDAWVRAGVELKRSKDADAAPVLGQETLFGQGLLI